MLQGMHRWAAALGVGLIGLFGLYMSAHASSVGGYYLGLALFTAAVLAILALVKQHFDGVPDDRVLDVWPSRRSNLWVLLALLVGLGLLGLFLAASGDDTLYWFGLALAVTCCLFAFRTLERIYDARDRAISAGGQGSDRRDRPR